MKKPPVQPIFERPVSTKRCCIQGCYEVADPHHLKTRGSGGTDDDYDGHNLLALCRVHHVEVHYISWGKFVKKYPMVKYALAEEGWHVIEEFGRMRLRRI